MINSNGNLVPSSDAGLSFFNRGFSYGDALFETVKAVGDKLLFWEDHYFPIDGKYAFTSHGDSHDLYPRILC